MASLIRITTVESYAQEGMTLEKCRSLALENNKAMTIAQRNQEKAEYTRNAYRANFFPKLSATANYLYTNAEMNRSLPASYLPTFVPDPATGQLLPNLLTTTGSEIPVFKEYAYFPEMDLSLKLSNTWMVGLRAEQPLFMGGKIATGYAMAKTGNEMARLNRELTEADLLVKVDEAYWLYVQTKEMMQAALSYQTVVGELLRNVMDAESVGLIHRNEVMKVQVKANEAELRVRQAENGVNLARKNLCHLMGWQLDSPVELPDAPEDIAWDGVDDAADYTARPEYALLQQQVVMKQQQVKLTRADFLPQIGVMANYGYMNGLELNGSKLIDKASFSLLASVTIPIFQWGEGRNKVRAAKVEQEIMQLQRDEMGEMMELELAKALDRCDESRLEVRLTSQSLQQAEENQTLSRDRYQEGMETLANYLEAQTVWQQAWSEHIRAKTNQRLNRTYYLKATGQLNAMTK